MNCQPILTARELRVIAMSAQGQTAKEIALVLNIAHRTVEKHLDSSRAKLRAKTRAHLVFLACRGGLLDLSKVDLKP